MPHDPATHQPDQDKGTHAQSAAAGQPDALHTPHTHGTGGVVGNLMCVGAMPDLAASEGAR